jgi:hypothetical protein
VWHVSVASLPKVYLPNNVLRQIAEDSIKGVGDINYEWHECSGYAYHIRRRLTVEKQKITGAPIDCRNTNDGLRRYETIKSSLPAIAKFMVQEELGIHV